MANQWFKFYGGEYLADTKIATLTAQERSCWVTLLCLASTSTIPGVVDFLTVEVLLKKSGIEFDPYHPEEWDNSIGILKKFERMRMIQTFEDGRIEVLNWEKRQERTAQTPYERVKKHRQNKAKIQNDNEMITHDNANDNDRIEENRIEENRIENIYTHYGEFQNVKLTDEQYRNLCGAIGEKNVQILIFELDTYIASKGKRYKNHYAVIQTWWRRKAQDVVLKTKTERRIV